MKHSRQEILFYLVVWGLLFAAPPLSLYIRAVNDGSVSFDWMDVIIVWQKFAVYLLLFIVHNFLLAPLLVEKHRRVAYFSIVIVIITAFSFYQCNSKPERVGEPKERIHHQAPPPHEMEPPGHDRPMPPPHFRPDKKPPVVGERDIMAIVMLVLLFGANLGIKSYFRSREDRKRLAELEKQSLAQQLEYLRYQINPHFFMNTLNNIHALVDIDPAKAQETIVELSKMMRFILYEGDKRGVPLTKEMEFIRTYVKLMQLRYTDKVSITLDLPSEVPDKTIPPLVLISFIENAFKHGVSYQRESFIDIKVSVEGETLSFSCRNSKVEGQGSKAEGQQGGVGLVNVRKRLDLLYKQDYSLSINDDANVYDVKLIIPLNNR